MKIKICFLLTSCLRSGPVRQTLNIIKYLDASRFEAVLVTLYSEKSNASMLEEFLPYVHHCYIPTNKFKIVGGYMESLHGFLQEFSPDIIHSLGIFPAYAVRQFPEYLHIMTLRSDMWEDFCKRYGSIVGAWLIRMQLKSMKTATTIITVSKSLADVYEKRLHRRYIHIHNGIDFSTYDNNLIRERGQLRASLGIPEKGFLCVYSGKMRKVKNQSFLLNAFYRYFAGTDFYLVLLGEGPDFKRLRRQFNGQANIFFKGQVEHVEEYLAASDVYVSTSKSEGMPNGVLEAMASGLPVVLSDIPQHLEILSFDSRAGFSYRQDDEQDLVEKIQRIKMADHATMGMYARQLVQTNFDAKYMSEKYQAVYEKMMRLDKL